MFEKLKALKAEFDEARLDLYTKAYNKFALNDDANMNLSAIIGLAVGVIVIAAIAPTAIETFYSTNTSGWQVNGEEDIIATSIWWLLPFITVIVFFYMVYKRIEG